MLIAVKLKDIVVDPKRDVDLTTLPHEEAVSLIRRSYGFLASIVRVEIQGDIALISFDDQKSKEVEEATRLCGRAGKRAAEGNYQKAVDIYKRALELDPGLLRARRDLAMACVELGEFDEAKNHLVEVLRLDPKDVWSWVVLANHYSKRENDFATAKKFYKRALEIKPDDAWALNGFGVLKTELGQPEDALKLFAAAIASQPKLANAYYAKAVILQSQGDLPAAVKAIKTLFREAEHQDARSIPVFEGARRLIVEVENDLAKKLQPDILKQVENYQAEVETLSGFPVRVSAEATPDATTAVAKVAWKHGREYHVINHTPSAPPHVAQHLIAHELTHIRLESLARQASKNKLFTLTAASRETAIRSIAGDIRRLEKDGYSDDSIIKATLQFVEETCRFLLNCPLDVIVEYYLRERIPDLQHAQFVSLGKMAVDAANSTMNSETRKLTPRKILQAKTALNGAYAILLDEFNERATNFTAVYQKQDTFGLSKNLASHWRSRHRQLGPGDEYNLVDEFADMLGLRDWYEWKLDAGKE